MYIGRPIKDYNPDVVLRQSRLSPRSSIRSSMSDFTDTTISTWNQRNHPPATEYPSVLSDRINIDRRPFQRRIEFDISNIANPGTSYADNVYRTSVTERMESLSDQLTKVLSTGAGSSHINGSLADSGIQTDNTSTSVPHIYIADAPVVKILKDAAVDTRNENNLQDLPYLPYIDDDDEVNRRTNIEKHKSMSNIPERIDEIIPEGNERLTNSLNRAKSPTFVEKFKKFFTDIGLVKADSDPTTSTNENNANTLPKSLSSSYRTRSATPNAEQRDASTLPKDMRFRRGRSTQTIYIRTESPLVFSDQEVQTREPLLTRKDTHVSVVKLNGSDDNSSSEVRQMA
ncbi:Phosphoribosylformylglycinamidine synthase subunit PurL [Operophtera brumata]|uniref:Phosphoribosylformylglycinamidine synthase subunit PurL n=1 Tax=Operophtera brumata TaxID=104452 RepID=A0A0L7LTM2_OPEBR|nr:Phosphoribosylformylglycinamidine synthase subunit PurL [Operophtera brumata]